MSTSSKKRLRETAGSEPLPKRRQLTRTLQVLYDEVKDKSQLLDEELSAFLRVFPDDESTVNGRNWITEVRSFLRKITTTGEVKREFATVFDEDFSTIFPNEIITQLNPRA